MNLCQRVALSVILCAIAAPAFADADVATITLGRDPEPPFCVMNPGGEVDIFWSIQHTTTPNFVRYTLQDPTRTINLESQVYPGNTGLNIARSWIVPNGLSDGKYWVRVEYWSFQSSNEANAEVTFYVCSESGDICAYKYEDVNCNGVLDPADTPVVDWWICFETPEDDIICRMTDANGRVCLENVPLGTYTIYEPEVPGWDPVGPSTYDVEVTVDGTASATFLNVREDFCQGACCFPDGSCVYTTESGCAEAGGIYQGNNVSCEPNPCPQPNGACCYPDGSCIEQTEEDCLANGGAFYGDFSLCEPNPCPQPNGACCFQDGSCIELTEEDCAAQGGTFYGDFSLCDPNPCPQPNGACCYQDGSCIEQTEEDCLANGGTFYGDFSLCDPNPCSQPLGACCFEDGGCVLYTEEDCIAQGGTYYGDLSLCDSNPCPQPLGACCVEYVCTITTEADCDGDWYGPGSTCDPTPCPPPPPVGACCVEYVCTITTEADCAGQWYGPGTTCDPTPCPPPPPTGACCVGADCVVVTEVECAELQGDYLGDGSVCEGVVCEPVPTDENSWGQIKNRYR